MSNIFSRVLIISPSALITTLLISADTVHAIGSPSLLANDNQMGIAAVEHQTSETQNQESQSDDIIYKPISTAPETEQKSQFSALPTPNPAKLKLAEFKLPSQVAWTSPIPESDNQIQPDVAAEAIRQTADTNLAQTNPAVPNNTKLLNEINTYGSEGGSNNSQEQVTNVTQLSDVRPTDWAYEALRSLVERYGCIAGYPVREAFSEGVGTFRGNRALSRYEFAAGLNACLQQVERLIAQSTSEFVTKSDLETLQRLVDEFKTELATLGTRVDKLEGRVAFLEDHQFSTTTKLSGEAIFALTDEFLQKPTNNTVFQDRVRLTFNTSFTGKDRLVTRLSAGNAIKFNDDFGTPFPEGIQTFFVGSTLSNRNNDVVLDKLTYSFNFGASKVYVAATGGIHSDYAPTLNPYFYDDDDGGNGALSTFASKSPIYRIGGGAGAAIRFGVGPLESILGPSTLTIGYLAGTNGTNNSFAANNPNEKAGLFDGDYAALAQLNFNLGDRIGIGATYVHGYHNTNTAIFDGGITTGGGPITLPYTPTNSDNDGISRGLVGSFAANNPGAYVLINRGTTRLNPVVTNSYGLQAAIRLTNNISISGFGSYTQAILLGLGRGDIWTYGAGVALSNFGKPGSVLGIFAGVQPTLRGLTPGIRPPNWQDRQNDWHVEAFYKYKLNDHISITPGVIWLPVTIQNTKYSEGLIGTLRTTFTF